MSDDEATESVLETVRERVDPTPQERAALRAVADELLERAEAAATERCPDADAILVGSTARRTWLRHDRDIDVFVRFPPDLDRDTLETYGLEVGRETLPDGRGEYAEHPYISGEYEGYDVDVVPCFRVEAATEIRSSVDRTPFHDEYLQWHLDDRLAADVRLAKGFLHGIGVYGSDLKTRGFSGYLTELLVVEYDGFLELLEAAADWHPPVSLDPEGHGTATFDDPLVVIDPTDPERNVAAVCSAESLARLQHHARAFLADPTIDAFEPDDPDPIDAATLLEHLERRATTPVAIRFDAPALVDDQLYPQLRKSLQGVTDGLTSHAFDVHRSTTFADETAVLFLELSVTERPAIERHDGPPVHVREHAENFLEAYADDEDTYGPFVDGERYVVEREREFTDATAFLESEGLFDVGLGTHVESALEDGYDLLVGEAVLALTDEFGRELRRYYEPRP